MKNIVFILLLNTFFAASSSGAELLRHRLELRYKISENYCLRLAERKVDNGSVDPYAFYYVVKIKTDQAAQHKSITQQFILSSSALSYARRFNRLKISDKEMIEMRKELLLTLQKQSLELANKLKKMDKLSKSTRLERKVGKLYAYKKTKKPGKTVKDVEAIPSVFEGGMYFGMPLGTELIPSSGEHEEKELVRILNVARKAKGLTELEWQEDLAKAARYHAYDMATQKYFSHYTHDRVDGELMKLEGAFVRIRKFYNATFVNTENIAAGSADAAGTYDQWYNSKGHHKNMFNKSATKVGVGLYYNPKSRYKYYWVFCTAY